MQKDELAEALIPLVNSTAFQMMMRAPRGALGKPEDAIAAAVRAYANREDVVERVAAFLWGHDTGEQWAELDAAGQADYRDTAIAAINAMLGGGDAE